MTILCDINKSFKHFVNVFFNKFIYFKAMSLNPSKYTTEKTYFTIFDRRVKASYKVTPLLYKKLGAAPLASLI